MEITIWLTYMCNLACTYCYEGNIKRTQSMSMETADRVMEFITYKINSLEKKEKINIVLYGGEPLLNFHVLHYSLTKLETLKKQSPFVEIAISLTTNATLLTKINMEILFQTVDNFAISIDGDRETHNKNRPFRNGENTFDIVENNAKIALKMRPDIMARMTISAQNVNNFTNNVKYIHNVGFKYIATALNQYDPNWTKANKKTLIYEMQKLAEYQLDCEKTDKQLIISTVKEIESRRRSVCLGGERTLHISPEGFFYPCSHLVGNSLYIIGDLLRGIDESKLEWIRKINSKTVTECRKCKWSEVCYGTRCKLINYVLTGDYYKPSPVTCMNEICLLKCNEYYHKLLMN